MKTNATNLKIEASGAESDTFNYRMVEFSNFGFTIPIHKRLWIALWMILTPIYFIITGNVKIPINYISVRKNK